ncbi:hypothetical protein [Paenibacillus sacheonensis]|uniref:Uncharacterized protein n=1 Tax=Paenibacillus sacheonensis TaxID=742054 RepID=A0A7X5C4M4_9BACL|nr:hypothetical protein [Paenibacillus sacheonensis]MBM7569303.1 hypothetical protein [Paenibacillus sacheonensis]NBC73515.1 hypothetical protein [Paenibacillus sacheonensis]
MVQTDSSVNKNGIEADTRGEVVIQLERRRARKRMPDSRTKVVDLMDFNGGPPMPNELQPAAGSEHKRDDLMPARVQAQENRQSDPQLAPMASLVEAVPERGIRPPIPAAFVHEQLLPAAGARPAKKRTGGMGPPKQADDAGQVKRMSEPRQRKRTTYSQPPEREPAILRDQ